MKRTSIAFCLLSLSLAAHAVRTDDVTTARFPDADSVTVDEIEKVKYNPDGTSETMSECWTKILTEKGRREESSITLGYNKRYGTGRILYVGAIGADGAEREIDVSRTTKESTDNSSMSANIYDPLDRKLVCSIPGLKVGETVHVKTMRKTEKARCKDKWADLSVMEWSHPILRSTYEVTAPASRPLRKIAIRHPLGNVVTNVTKLADGSLVHTFTVTNSAQVFPEPDMPPLFTQVQHIRVSTAKDWPEISKWYWDLCAPHLAKTNAAMVAKAKELKTVEAIFKFVSQEVRYMGLTMEDTSPGYAPHDVDITFDNRYGVCRDKAGLLTAMLRLAGFDAYPVLIHCGAKLDPEVPQPFFNHAIVAVDLGGRNYRLMDPTNESTKDLYPAYLCNNSYLVARPDGETLRTSPVPSPEQNALVGVSSGKLMKDGSLFLENELRFNGINDTAYRGALVKQKPEDRVKLFEKVVKALSPGAELIRCDIEPKDMRDTTKPLVVKMASKLPEMILRGETRSELTVPFATKALGVVNFLLAGNTSLEKRKFPLVIDTTACVREQLTLDLGGSFGRPLELPAAGKDGMDGFRYVRGFALKDDVLTAERSLTVGAVEFSPAEYARLREEIKKVEAAERKRPVFAEDTLKEADVRWLLESNETTVHSDVAWTTTNTIVKEVLTYAGKKNSAEIKIGFNPHVEAMDVTYATVSNRDGRVYSVSAKEKNVMDCGWAATAPRYPAGKLLVVNLPSVEIGSVISYQVVHAVTNAPAPFYAAYTFDSHEPVDRRFVRVDGWQREVKGTRRLPNEPNQPAACFWRDHEIISRNDWAKAAERLRKAVEVSAIDPYDALGWHQPSSDPFVLDKVSPDMRDVRDWMAKYVKVAGPSLYELPLEQQLTDPAVIVKERYATRLDYVRTLCALLRGAGYDADVVFVAPDANDPEEVKNRIKYEKPNVRVFAAALCRVRVREGGFLWFGGETKEYFIGTENEYAPIGPTGFNGCDYFDPESGEFGVVTVPEAEFADSSEERSTYCIRENGAVDLTVESVTCGSGVGGFRKIYAEILPEDRSRRYQAILGKIAQAASATSDLETDIKGYPASSRFSCFIPDFATVQGDAITIQIPPLVSSVPACIGRSRQTPFALGGTDPEREQVTIRFPEGYTEVESLPRAFAFANPLDSDEIWMEGAVSTKVEGNALVVTLTRIVHKRKNSWFKPSFYELVKDWNRIANSRANRTITVRRTNH